jgi:hypothetical protein
VALALAAVLVVPGCGRLGGEAFQATHSRVLQLDDAQRLGQSFRPATDRIAGVDLLTASFAGPADARGTLELRLLHRVDGPQLALATVPGEAVEDNAWLSVRFDAPVAVSEQAVFDVRWRGAAPIGLYANVPPDPPVPRMPPNDPYSGGELLINGERAAGDLAFRAVNPSRPADLTAALSGLLRETGARLLDRPGFTVVWLLLVAAAAGLGLAGLTRAQLLDRGPGKQRGEHEEGAEQHAEHLPG